MGRGAAAALLIPFEPPLKFSEKSLLRRYARAQS